MVALGSLLSIEESETVVNHLTNMVLRDADFSVRYIYFVIAYHDET